MGEKKSCAMLKSSTEPKYAEETPLAKPISFTFKKSPFYINSLQLSDEIQRQSSKKGPKNR